jgi:hypothetical protein
MEMYILCNLLIIILNIQLDHGKIIGDHMTYGYEIQYECDDGYILVGGDAIRSCSSCGEWTGKMPTCAGMLWNCFPFWST